MASAMPDLRLPSHAADHHRHLAAGTHLYGPDGRYERRQPVTCNFNYRIETEGLRKVTGSHVLYKSRNISETVQDNDVVTTLIGRDI